MPLISTPFRFLDKPLNALNGSVFLSEFLIKRKFGPLGGRDGQPGSPGPDGDVK
jgi:hypothetical protein